jgi:ligand-binding sensor domain-containing protein
VKLSRRAQAVLAIAAGVLCFVAGTIIWRTERALRGSQRQVDAGQFLGVSVRPLALSANPGFEPISAPATFRSAAFFNGRLYLAGPAGLFAYSSQGALEHVDRVGLDLPPAPLGAMAVGTLANSHAPELLIATAGEGVLAYDGHRFRQILPADKPTRTVTALLPLNSGRLLLGTGGSGLLVYDGKTLQAFHSTTRGIYVTALAGDEAGLWIGTLDRGLLHWSGGRMETLGEAQGLPDARVECVAAGTDAIYAGTPAGIAEVRNGSVTRVIARGSYIRSLLTDDGALYAGQLEGSVLRIDLRTNASEAAQRRRIVAPQETAPEATGAPVEQLLRAGDARYAVRGGALLRLEPGGEWHDVLVSGGGFLSDRNISSLLAASDGRLWVGYFDRGLDILPAGGGRPNHIEDDRVFCVNRAVEDPRQSAIAVATANGLVLFDRDGRQKQVLTRSTGLIADHVTDVALAPTGLVAATPAGITFLEAGGPHSMYAFQGLINNHVYALAARENSLLVGTLGGISLLGGGSVRRNVNTGNSALRANWITAFASSGEGWLAGTYGAGVYRIAADGSVNATDASAQGTVVNPGAMISDGRLVLAGTLGGGLLVADATGMRWKTITAGLPSLNVTALAIDRGTVYVGTDNGLVKIAEDRL